MTTITLYTNSADIPESLKEIADEIIITEINEDTVHIYDEGKMDYAMWLRGEDCISDEDCRKIKSLKENIPSFVDVVMVRHNNLYFRELLVRNKRKAPSGNLGTVFFSDISITDRAGN